MKINKAITAAVLAMAMTASVSPPGASAEEVASPPSVTVEVDPAGGLTSTTVVDDPAGIEADVVVDFAAAPSSTAAPTSMATADSTGSGSGTAVGGVTVADGGTVAETDAGLEAGAQAVAALAGDDPADTLELKTIAIDAVVEGERVAETLVVEDFALLGGTDFRAALRVQDTGEVIHLDTTVVQEQALPALFVLGVLARLGIRHVITWYGRTQVKSAVKSYLLNSVSAEKWGHILASKHNWHLLGARSREQVADLMGRAMAEGSHSGYGSAMQAVWRHNGRTITVTYDKASGKVSNGWVN